MTTIYGIKNCDTMKKARTWLDAKKVAHQFHDYKASGIDKPTLEGWVRKVGWEILLNRAGNQFAEKVDAESAKMSGVAAHVTSSAVEVSSLGESFSFAVQLFNDANEKLIANLQRIEVSMDKSMVRSDDQLAYYVAQAREIIDLSTMSQKDIVDNLRQLAGRQMPLAEEAS